MGGRRIGTSRTRHSLLDYPAHPFVCTVKAILQAALHTRAQYRAGAPAS
jgi:hypothetical protein